MLHVHIVGRLLSPVVGTALLPRPMRVGLLHAPSFESHTSTLRMMMVVQASAFLTLFLSSDILLPSQLLFVIQSTRPILMFVIFISLSTIASNHRYLIPPHCIYLRLELSCSIIFHFPVHSSTLPYRHRIVVLVGLYCLVGRYCNEHIFVYYVSWTLHSFGLIKYLLMFYIFGTTTYGIAQFTTRFSEITSS